MYCIVYDKTSCLVKKTMLLLQNYYYCTTAYQVSSSQFYSNRDTHETIVGKTSPRIMVFTPPKCARWACQGILSCFFDEMDFK